MARVKYSEPLRSFPPSFAAAYDRAHANDVPPLPHDRCRKKTLRDLWAQCTPCFERKLGIMCSPKSSSHVRRGVARFIATHNIPGHNAFIGAFGYEPIEGDRC